MSSGNMEHMNATIHADPSISGINIYSRSIVTLRQRHIFVLCKSPRFEAKMGIRMILTRPVDESLAAR